jgi:hypothetical protein
MRSLILSEMSSANATQVSCNTVLITGVSVTPRNNPSISISPFQLESQPDFAGMHLNNSSGVAQLKPLFNDFMSVA